MPTDLYNGILLIDKPAGKSSHDVVDAVRRVLKQRSVGHTGTLDPAATGLLVICVGRGTKIARYLTVHDKVYEAEVVLGKISTTYDAEGVLSGDGSDEIPTLTEQSIEPILKDFTGVIEQQVPAYSAVKVDGQRLYEAARAGEKVAAPIREVEIRELRLLSHTSTTLRLLVHCGSGTYIRSLAHDIGQKLGCGAYLGSLRRLAVGRFNVDDASSIDELRRMAETGNLEKAVIPLEAALDLVAVRVSDKFVPRIATGVRPGRDDIEQIDGAFAAGDPVALVSNSGRLLAVGRAEVDSDRFTAISDKALFSFERVLAQS